MCLQMSNQINNKSMKEKELITELQKFDEESEVDRLKYETVSMIYDGKNWIIIPDEEVQFLNKGNRKERKTNAKIFNKKYGIEK